jgi:hypothetical protein
MVGTPVEIDIDKRNSNGLQIVSAVDLLFYVGKLFGRIAGR